ncbi:MAG: hypothetical protein N2747_00970 [Chitinophagaceae bacterium]|nr:hypothetical protein [Chitinophagaceae bacterium]
MMNRLIHNIIQFKKITTVCIFIVPVCYGYGKDSDAVRIVKKIIESLGGQVWLRPESLILKGYAYWSPHGIKDRDSAFLLKPYYMYRIFPDTSHAAHGPNGKIRFDAYRSEEVFLRLIYDGKQTQQHLHALATKYKDYFSWSNNFGFGIIRFCLDEGFNLKLLQEDDLDGHHCYVLYIRDPSGMKTWFWVDKKKYFIRGMGFNTPLGWHLRIYSNYKKDKKSGFVQPKRVRIYFEGIKWIDIYWNEFDVNRKLDDNLFLIDETRSS